MKTSKELIIRARSDHKLKNQDPGNIEFILLQWVKILGISNAPNTSEVTWLASEIKHLYPNLTGQDLEVSLRLCLNKTIDGKTDHNHELTVKFISGILNSYIPYRNKIITEKLREENRLEENKTLELSFEDSLRTAISAFEKYKTKSVYIDWGNYVYNFLDHDCGVIPFTLENKRLIFEEAKTALVLEYNTRKFKTTNPFEVKDINLLINKVLSGSEDIATHLISKSKEIALYRFFDFLIESEQLLGEFVNENKKL